MAHVFISYAHVDFEFAENLKHRLEKAGFEAWMDEERLRAGEDWREEIDHAIKNAFALILIISSASLSSQYVMYEWAFAWGAEKKVVPILLQMPDDENRIHPRLDKRQYLDFTNRIRPWDKLQKRLEEIKTLNTSHSPTQNMTMTQNNLDPKISKLLSELNDSNPGVRLAALKILAQMQDPSPALLTLLNILRDVDEVWVVRVAAIAVLGDIGKTESVLDLLLVLNSEDSVEIQCAVIMALGEIGDEEAVPDLIEKLSDTRRYNNSDSFVCDYAAEALKRIGTVEALEVLVEWQQTGGDDHDDHPDSTDNIPF